MNANRLKWLGFGALLLMLAVLGSFLIHAHIVGLWMDPEFTDWVSPIANRLHDGARLYTDGMHFPMPPIPYVFLRVLYPRGAIWIYESLFNYVFVSATILLLYLVFARKSGAALAFAACAATVPLFLNLSKTILYDSMTQFLVVVVALLCTQFIEASDADANFFRSRKFLWGLLTGAASGLLLLTKQSTGMGVVAGAMTVLVFLPAGPIRLRARCRNIFVFLLAMVATFFLVAIAVTQYESVSGMLHDVFLAGAEPKGGNRRILSNLISFAASISLKMAIALAVFWVGSALFRRKWNRCTQSADFEHVLNSATEAKGMPLKGQEVALFATLIMSVICAGAACWLPESGAVFRLYGLTHSAQVTNFLLDLGFAACVLLIIASVLPALRGAKARFASHPFAPLAIIFFCAATFHNLSVSEFRWTYDNNPLIALALVFLLGPIIGGFLNSASGKWARVQFALFAVILVYMWTQLFVEVKLAQSCTESWPEIPHLAGARLRPECDGLRQMVKLAQSNADKAKNETVLLLPEDPNVQAWIDRARPPVSSCILFTDQYWDAYVDSDFTSLQKNPPKIIIIGPRSWWRTFAEHWHKNTGVIRLIDRVGKELLPARYELLKEQPISYLGRQEFMDVYVRRER